MDNNTALDVALTTQDAIGVAKNHQAPPDERQAATIEVAKATSNAVPHLHRAGLVQAALRANQINERVKRYHNTPSTLSALPRTGDPAEFGIFRPYDYVRRPAPLGFSQLRLLMQYDPILSSIIFTRVRQVSRLAKPVQYDHEPGFRLFIKGKRRASKLSEAETTRLEYLENFIMNCGAEFDPFARDFIERERFMDYLKLSTLDSLSMDAMPAELLRTPTGRLHGWKHVDGATIYLTPPDGLPPNARPPDDTPYEDLPDPDLVKAIEADDGGRVINWFPYGNLTYPIRNPRPDIVGQGYGMAESEMMLRIITAFINLLTHNQKAFEDNHIPQGFLQLYGEFKQDDIEDFRNEWAAYVSGVSNAWRLPLLVSEKGKEAGANFVNTGIEVSEMQFVKFLTLLIAVQCALYGMDPEEIGFESYNTKSSALTDSSIEGKLVSSRDKGLYPLLQFHEDHINTLLHTVDPDVTFKWCGFENAQDTWERDQKALTFGELRERQGLEPTGIKLLDEAPIDPSMQGVYLQAVGQQTQGFEGENLDAAQAGQEWPPQQAQEGEEQAVPKQPGEEPRKEQEGQEKQPGGLRHLLEQQQKGQT